MPHHSSPPSCPCVSLLSPGYPSPPPPSPQGHANPPNSKTLRIRLSFQLSPLLFTYFFQVSIELVTILLLFYVLVFWGEACGILAPQPRIEPAPLALEGEVLTTGLSG